MPFNTKKYFILFISCLILSGCTRSKYEGLTAEEWSDEYSDVKSQFVELQNEKDDLEQQYNTCNDDLETANETIDEKDKKIQEAIKLMEAYINKDNSNSQTLNAILKDQQERANCENFGNEYMGNGVCRLR